MNNIKITFVSDLHGFYPKLEGGDLLIVAGDLTARDEPIQYKQFYTWLEKQKYKKIIYIAGNHDNYLQEVVMTGLLSHIEYLCDSGTEFEGLKIWGSPWSATFRGMNPHCKAFTMDSEIQLKEKWDLIPNDTDILITHAPPYGILDTNDQIRRCGSASLAITLQRVKPLYSVFGHIHEQGGKKLLYKNPDKDTWCINASHVNERYEPVNAPITIVL